MLITSNTESIISSALQILSKYFILYRKNGITKILYGELLVLYSSSEICWFIGISAAFGDVSSNAMSLYKISKRTEKKTKKHTSLCSKVN